MTIREMCPKADYPEDGFNEVSPCLSENLFNALSKLTTNQENMERQLKNKDEKIQAKSSSIDTNTIENNNQFQNINQPRPFTHNSQVRSTTPFTGSFRTGFSKRGRLIRPYFSPRGPSLQGFQPRFNQPYQSRHYQYQQNFQTKTRLPETPYIPVTQASNAFCYICGYQTTPRANATAEAEAIPAVPHFHSKENQKISKATQ